MVQRFNYRIVSAFFLSILLLAGMVTAQDQTEPTPIEDDSSANKTRAVAETVITDQASNLPIFLRSDCPPASFSNGGCGTSGCSPNGGFAYTRQVYTSSSGCTATWDGTHWKVTSKCTSDCRCGVPAVSSATTFTDPSFPCVSNANATAEQFFIDLCGRDIGIQRLSFDKSTVELFDRFSIKVVDKRSRIAWEILATYDPRSYEPVLKPDTATPVNFDARHPASAVVTCHSENFGDVPTAKSFNSTHNTFMCKFGHWELTIKYMLP